MWRFDGLFMRGESDGIQTTTVSSPALCSVSDILIVQEEKNHSHTLTAHFESCFDIDAKKYLFSPKEKTRSRDL